MPDQFERIKDLQSAEIVKAVSAWERRLRGWDVFDHLVDLEPPFRQIRPAIPPATPVRDDARLAFGRGVLLSRNNNQFTPADPPLLQPVESVIRPTAFHRKESPWEIQILLSEGLDFAPAVTEQFFLSLSSSKAPLSFELIADNEQVTVQMACDPVFAPDLRNQLSSFFPGIFINEVRNALDAHLDGAASRVVADFGLSRSFIQPLQTFRSFTNDPLTGLLSSMGNLQPGERAVFQVLFQKCRSGWYEELLRIAASCVAKERVLPDFTRFRDKFSAPLFAVAIRMAVQSSTDNRGWQILRHLGGNLSQFSTPNGNELIAVSNDGLPAGNHILSLINRTSYRTGMLLNASELASLAHFPVAANPRLKRFRNDSKAAPSVAIGHEFVMGVNRHMGETKTVSISADQRTRHMVITGGTGVGKSNFLLHQMKQDLEHDHGLCLIDPHGDLVDAVTENIPESRRDDVILFDAADSEYPIPFNILHAETELEKTLLASDLVATFRRFSTSWGDVMDSVLANAILAFVQSTCAETLFELKRFLVEKDFRNEFLETVTDDAVVYFWRNEFPLLHGKPQSSILIRLDSFLRQRLIRNIVCQKTQTLNFREIMDDNKILLIKLSQGLIGDENSHLLGTLLISKLQQTALSRQDIAADQRRFFAIYVDEFHHFVTPSLATLLSGIRKYGIGLTLATQSHRQVAERDSAVASSVLTNCGTRICFRLGDADAEKFANGFSFFDARALQNLGIGEAIARIERAEFDFNLRTPLVPKVEVELGKRRTAEVVRLTRKRYSRPRSEVEAEFAASRPTMPVARRKAEPTAVETPATVVQLANTRVKPPVHNVQVVQNVDLVSIDSRLPETTVADRNLNHHRYLQSIVKRMAEGEGFQVTLEKPVFGGIGKVDVAIENEEHKIACEIAHTNTVDYELQNLQKCLASGFDRIVIVSTDTKHLDNIKKRAELTIPDDILPKVSFVEMENFYLFLETLPKPSSKGLDSPPTRVKGYDVNMSFRQASESESKVKEKVVLDIISDVLRRNGGGSND